MVLPLFPLNLVVFPKEELNLHIFEPRYKQLVNDCINQKATFGIPVFLENKIQEIGVEVQITALVNRYPDGRMDIKTRGERIFRLKSFFNPMLGKMHAGGEVEFLETEEDSDMLQRLLFIEAVSQLYEILNIKAELKSDVPFLSYQYAHKIGLSLRQEYELLTLLAESERIDYLIEHLRKSIPIVREMERTKQVIRMNGHFKNLDPLKF
ncbi:MAG: LON peptidase substrate-binding domain-containing protein [Thermoflexibacter sp.]